MFEELYIIAYFVIGLILLGAVAGVNILYDLYLAKRKPNNGNSVDTNSNRVTNNTFDPVGDNDWK